MSSGPGVKIRTSDTKSSFLFDKIKSIGGSIAISVTNPGADEILNIEAGPAPGGDFQLLTPEEFQNGETLGTGVAVYLDTLGYSDAEANAAFPLTSTYLGGNIDATVTTIDFAASCETILSTEDAAYQNWVHFGCYSGKHYVMDAVDSLPLPKTTTKESNMWGFEGFGCTIEGLFAADNSVFKSLPADQTEANNIVARSFVFQNFQIYGNASAAGSGQAAFEIGACVYPTFRNIQTSSCDTGWRMMFCLFAEFTTCAGIGNATDNWFLSAGNWTGASSSNSQCNDADFLNCRAFNALESQYGFHLEDSSDINLFGCTTEGPEEGSHVLQPIAGIYFEDNNSTVVKNFNITGLHAEQSYTGAVVWILGREGIYNVAGMFNQVQGLYVGANTDYIRLESNAGVVQVFYDQGAYPTANMTFYSENHSCRWEAYNSAIAGNPTTAVTWVALGATFWNGTVPAITEVRITPLL